MNTEQLSVWKGIVRQCKSRLFGSINVASSVRSDAILAANTLAELVTPELVGLLERLALDVQWLVNNDDSPNSLPVRLWRGDAEVALALVARIREALAQEANDAKDS